MLVKTLTIVVPCYNSEGYLRRCLDSLMTRASDVEILVVDDGSTDGTGAIAESYAERFPALLRVIHQPNRGHGGAVNTGIREASGRYLKIVDSDDWLDAQAFDQVLRALRGFGSADEDIDAVVSNFVYEKVGKRRKKTVRYRGVLPVGRAVTWDEVGDFGAAQYILMHALIYRTEMLRACGLQLPEHTFYVDNLYSYVPLRHVRRLYYVDVDLYRYFIGRPDQSVNESVLLGRMDQYLRINRAMVAHLSEVWPDPTVSPVLKRYLLHFAEIVCSTSSVLLTRAGTPDASARRDEFWADLRREHPWLHQRLRHSAMARLSNLPGRSGKGISRLAYRAARGVVGFN
ncbi:glycosyltransferase family 2 protein [Brooklawnia cerclae]|uniref:Glycosyltransferase involved in cell wall biosynthesis n=1 Tax=Brooklawnia cerclae TaxID=349934 RepID=A0ABX0SH26_9ACTN|nr:glycosyltransferase family 2 protein [Brooklawnia cerclae]NIH57703.1 glycosyltransferase involved in cell wall biosynthesis [Brooklawnia cerclae]